MLIKFKVGDKVRWTSQAGGAWKEKTGIVDCVVPPRVHPNRIGYLGKLTTTAYMRDHESYVIVVQLPKSVRYYWPIVNKLEKI